MCKRWITGVLLAAALGFGGGVADAASVSLTSVEGVWTSLTPPVGPTDVNGLDTSAVNWGTPATANGQSGYSFTGAPITSVTDGTEFDLGVFTHNNRTILAGTSITGATLAIAVNIMIGTKNETINLVYDFAHLETVNSPGRRKACANGQKNKVGVNKNGCADRVTLAENEASESEFVIDGITYILQITGFFYNGTTLSEFWTTENLANSAILRAKLTMKDVPTSPVPLPATGSLALGALGALLLARRLRRSA